MKSEMIFVICNFMYKAICLWKFDFTSKKKLTLNAEDVNSFQIQAFKRQFFHRVLDEFGVLITIALKKF